MTLYIGQQHPSTVYMTGFWVCFVLVLNLMDKSGNTKTLLFMEYPCVAQGAQARRNRDLLVKK